MAIRRTPGPTTVRTRRTLCLIAPRSTTARVARREGSHAPCTIRLCARLTIVGCSKHGPPRSPSYDGRGSVSTASRSAAASTINRWLRLHPCYRSTCRGEPVTPCERLVRIILRHAVCVWPPAAGWPRRPARRQAQETVGPGAMSHHDAGTRAWAWVLGGPREPAMEQGTPLAGGLRSGRCARRYAPGAWRGARGWR